MQAEPNVVSFRDLLPWTVFCFSSLMLKLLAYFDEATVSLYFAQSVFWYK